MIYNTSNLTGIANPYEIALGVNQLESSFIPILLFTLFAIVVYSLNVRYNIISSLLAGSFLINIIAIIMRPIGLISTDFLVISISFTAILAAVAIFQNRRG